MAVINRIAGFHDDITAWRRHLHAHPELGFQEHATSAFVAQKLREFGVDEVHTGLAETGVVGVIRAGSGARAIGLRADMDALPIHEETGLPWASVHPGLMHACGHDGHTAMLLGAARYLAETRNFDGTVYLIFQPAEELGGEDSSGGSRMVAEGLFDRFPAERVFGLHNWPELPLGRFAMGTGPVMAAVDEFTIQVRGKGGHAAMPHQCRDPLLAGCQIVQALQSIVAREVDPIDNAVVVGDALPLRRGFNVIAETAEIGGTVRTFKAETRARIEQRLEAIAGSIATALGRDRDVEFLRGYPPTVNDAADVGARRRRRGGRAWARRRWTASPSRSWGPRTSPSCCRRCRAPTSGWAWAAARKAATATRRFTTSMTRPCRSGRATGRGWSSA